MIYASNIIQAGSRVKFTLSIPIGGLYNTFTAILRYTVFTCGFNNNLKTIIQ